MKILDFSPIGLPDNLEAWVAKDKISNQFIYKLVNELVLAYHLEDYIKDVIITDKESAYWLGTYYHKSKLIVFHKPFILSSINKTKKFVVSKYNKYHYEAIYSELYAYVVHEVMHALQRKKYAEDLDSIEHDITEMSIIAKKDRKFYRQYHDLFPFEHHADAVASLLRNRYMYVNQINTDDREQIIVRDGTQDELTMDRNNRFDAFYLINNYEMQDGILVSPIEKFLELTKDKYNFKFDLSRGEELDTLNKLLFGFPIDKEKYNKINEVYEGKQKIKNIDTFITTLD